LSYANALIPAARLMIGVHHGDDATIADSLRQLRWLVELQHGANGFSLIPHVGWEPGEVRARFDQQPIELWHLAEAAERAHQITGDDAWLAVITECVRWFDGANDLGAVLYDRVTGGGCDGLRLHGVNRNQGAESTLACIAVRMIADRVGTPDHSTQPRWALA
jgi:hypothetical protein